MEQRTVVRFSVGTILIHWIHTIAFAVLLITGTLMFFHLTDFSAGSEIRMVHRVAAAIFIAIPVMYAIVYPRSASGFLKESFQWGKDDLLWLKTAISYYFGGRKDMPPQGRINGGQKLWQLIVITTGTVLILTGIVLWFFRFKIPLVAYQGVLLVHALAFIVVAVIFLLHIYVAMFHPRFSESLSSMLDGKVSDSYARAHYSKWYRQKTGGQKSP
jgi:formate dehydrogenase subunit gamma